MHWCIYEYIPLPPRQCSLTTCTATARRPTLGRRSPPPAPPPPNACSWALRRHPTACSTSSGAHAMSVLTMVIRKGMGLGGRSGVSRKQIRGGGGAHGRHGVCISISTLHLMKTLNLLAYFQVDGHCCWAITIHKNIILIYVFFSTQLNDLVHLFFSTLQYILSYVIFITL